MLHWLLEDRPHNSGLRICFSQVLKGRALCLCRQPYVGDVLFYSVTAAFVGCVLVVLSADARSKGVSFPLGSIASLFASPQEPTETS